MVAFIIKGLKLPANRPGAEGDPEPSATPVLYALFLKRDGENASYEAKLISDQSGIGTNFTIKDMNGDGKPDVVTGNKNGLYLHSQ